MLTGDKLATAQQIAVACGMIGEGQCAVVSGQGGQQSIAAELRAAADTVAGGSGSLIVEGPALRLIFANPNLRQEFLHAARSAHSVICCRTSPQQKAQVIASLCVQSPSPERVRVL
jgi:phospholipid-translocating ATPase